MKSKKATKRALLSSALSLVLCFSMLLGTTFAWFTDEVSTKVNIIKSGTLDVQLNYGDDGVNYEDASEKVIFDYKFWEPGYTEYKYVQIKNAGDLALRYQLDIIPEKLPVEGEPNLADVIEVRMIPAKDAKTMSRKQMLEVPSVGTLAELMADPNGAAYGVMLPEEGKGSDDFVLNDADKDITEVYSVEYCIVLHMQEDADNLYQNLSVGDGFRVRLMATQYTYENDSFDNNYDDGAYLPVVYDATELASALENNESVKLGANIVLTGEWTPIGDKDAGVYYTGTLDGNGYTISGLSVTTGDYVSLISAAKDATIKNLTVEGSVSGKNAAGIVARVEGNTVIENCVSNVAVTGTTKAGGIVSNVTGADAKIINCVNNADITWSNAAVGGVGGIVGYVNNDAYLEIINCTNNGDVTSQGNTYAGAAVGYAAAPSSGMIAGFTNTGVITGTILSDGRYVKDGETVLCGYATPANWTTAKTINNAADLAALGGTKINGTYMLMADIDMLNTAMEPMEVSGGANVTFEGNDHTISNLTLGAAGIHGMTGAGNEVAGLFDLTAPATTVSLTVSDLTVKNATVSCSGYAAAIVGYNPNGGTVITLNNVDVAGAAVTSDTVAALVGYTTGVANLTDCDVSNLSLTGEEGRPDKVGAYVGTANTATCTVTVKDCTNDTAYSPAGRVINGATLIIGEESVVIDTATLIEKIKNAPVGETTEIVLADGTYDGDINITLAALGQQGGDVVIKAAQGAKPVVTGTVTLGLYKKQTTNVARYDANVTFEGITFDHAEAETHSIDVQNVKSLNLTNCTVIGDGEYGIGSASGNPVGASKITGCIFKNGAMQISGNFGGTSDTNLLISDCTFTESVINIQGGYGVTVQDCKFTSNTVTDAHNNESFYVIRSQAIPVTVTGCEFYVDSTVTGTGVAGSKGWGVFVNRNTADWTVSDVKITMTDAAVAQTALQVANCLSTGKIIMTNVTVNGTTY